MDTLDKRIKFGLIALLIVLILFCFLSYLGTHNVIDSNIMELPKNLPVDLPESNRNIYSKDAISVSLFADGTISVGSDIVAENKLEDELRSRLSVKKDKSIMLNADRNSSTGDLVYILDLAKQNKWKIAMATKPN